MTKNQRIYSDDGLSSFLTITFFQTFWECVIHRSIVFRPQCFLQCINGPPVMNLMYVNIVHYLLLNLMFHSCVSLLVEVKGKII